MVLLLYVPPLLVPEFTDRIVPLAPQAAPDLERLLVGDIRRTVVGRAALAVRLEHPACGRSRIWIGPLKSGGNIGGECLCTREQHIKECLQLWTRERTWQRGSHLGLPGPTGSLL
jgi:hypothetical protein